MKETCAKPNFLCWNKGDQQCKTIELKKMDEDLPIDGGKIYCKAVTDPEISVKLASMRCKLGIREKVDGIRPSMPRLLVMLMLARCDSRCISFGRDPVRNKSESSSSTRLSNEAKLGKLPVSWFRDKSIFFNGELPETMLGSVPSSWFWLRSNSS